MLIHQNLLKKTDLTRLKSDIDELDVDELKTVNLSELSNVVDNDVIKKTEYNKLVTKINTIDASGKEKKINVADLVLSSITGLASTAALNVVENKIPTLVI